MSLLTRILDRARGKSALFDLHPDLEWRIPMLRVYSDEESASQAAGFTGNIQFFNSHTWVRKAIKVLKDNVAPLYLRVV